MAETYKFVPLIGEYWTETLSNDPIIRAELKRIGLSKYLRQSRADLTMLGKNKRLVLRYLNGEAFSIWEKKLLAPRQNVISCVLFINNSQKSTKDLLDEAMEFARLRWLDYSYYVNVTPKLHPEKFEETLIAMGWKNDLYSAVYTSTRGSIWEKLRMKK